jgi:glutamine amidotransferase
MCQLFALSCNVPAAVTFSFTGLAARGGRTGEHADGFGVAFHDDAACRLFVDDQPASRSALAEFLRHHPIRARTVLAHIRKATQGPVRWANCHPFLREWNGRHWSFAHNGDLQGFKPRLVGGLRPVGQTDSERAFCWLLQQLRQRFRSRQAPGWQQLAPVMAELAAEVARHGRFNFLASDGQALYAHASTSLHLLQRRHPFPVAHLVDEDLSLDLSVDNGPGDRMVLVATEPLTRNEGWAPMAPGELRVFVAGEQVWCSTPAAPARCPEAVAHPLLPGRQSPLAFAAAGG